MNESGKNNADCCRKVASGRKVTGAVRSIVMLGVCSLSVRGCYMRDFSYLLCCMAEKMIWREKERSRIRAVQMDNLRGLLGVREMDRVPNAIVRELCGVTKGVDESILRWWAC